MFQNHVIIVAGGSGTRMGTSTPKQFLQICNIPIIIRSIQRFLDYDSAIKIVVVLPKAHFETWMSIKNDFLKDMEISIVAGGDKRTDSVRSGLQSINSFSNLDLVAIHDAVRPLVSIRSIAASFESAKKKGSGIVAVVLKDSIREITNNTSKARNRDVYRLVQTPQTFGLRTISAAYTKLKPLNEYSDDAAVYEAFGEEVYLVDGDFENLKITTPEDIQIAEAVLNKER